MPRFRTNVSRVSVSICVIANRSSGRKRSLTRSNAAASDVDRHLRRRHDRASCPSLSVRYACAASASVAITSVSSGSTGGICP